MKIGQNAKHDIETRIKSRQSMAGKLIDVIQTHFKNEEWDEANHRTHELLAMFQGLREDSNTLADLDD